MNPSLELDVTGVLRDVEALLQRTLASDDPQLARIAGEVVGSGGKRLRPRVVLLSFAACGGLEPSRALLEVAAGVELIHAASLVHDDIIDRAALRRGKPTVQEAHGEAVAIVVGDFLLTQGFSLAGRQDEETVAITHRSCTRLSEGELLELRSMARPDLTTEEYLRIIRCKTAALLEGAGRVGAHFAGRDDLQGALGAYGDHLGVAFQVTDDLLDVRGDPAVTGKPRGTDLRSGAPNAAVLFGLRNGARARLERLLASHERPEGEVEAALEALQRSGAIAEAERLAQEHAARAVEALAPLPDSSAKRELVALARGLASRSA